MMQRRQLLRGFCSCTAVAAFSGCTALVAPEGRVEPGYRPLQATDEGGLWQMVEKSEAELKRSRALLRDADLQAYIAEVAARLAGPHADDLRVYILRMPHFNASMAPNGMMQLWTGLLLRVHNEAQLAAVLGHEMGHYLERHTLQRWRDLRLKTDLLAFASLGISAAGYGQFSEAANLATLATIMAFSREQERQADAVGYELMANAGYPPIEASKVWEQLVAEQEAQKDDKGGPVSFFKSHPASAERMATLRARAEADAAATTADNIAGRYRARIRPIRSMLLKDELRLRQYARSLVVLDLLAAEGEDGELAFYRGEVHRLRDEDGDRAHALAAFERAIAQPDCPAEAHRSLGLLYRQVRNDVGSEAAFRRYLELRPGAADAGMIRSWLRG